MFGITKIVLLLCRQSPVLVNQKELMSYSQGHSDENLRIPIATIPSITAKQPRVIIIGAGISGLAAAEHLRRNGFTNVTVLEASNRIGGRIHSAAIKSAVCELGAPYLEKSLLGYSTFRFNAMYGDLPTLFDVHPSEHFIDGNGNLLNRTCCSQARQLFEKIQMEGNKIYKEKTKTDSKPESLLDFYINKIQSQLTVFNSGDRSQITAALYGLLSSERENFGTDLNNVNVKLFGISWNDCCEYFRVPTGFMSLLNSVVGTLPNGTVQLEKPVSHVTWKNERDDETIIVKCADGTSLKADYVICTLSLGVLKGLSDYFFIPHLPPMKKQAIQNIGFGTIEKICLEYDVVPDRMLKKGLNFAWSPMELTDRNNWIHGLIHIQPNPDDNRVIELTITGTQAEELDLLSDKNLILNVTSGLRKLFKNEEIPYPKNVLRSNWARDVKYLGARPFFSLKTKLSHILELEKPLTLKSVKTGPIAIPRLLFAGEATTIHHFGTLQGAHMSGIRESDRIIKFTRFLEDPPL